MRVRSKILRILFFPLLAVLPMQLTLAETYYGSVNYTVDWNEKEMTGYIDFGVYDDRAAFESDFSSQGLTAPGDGNYVYAYRITQSDVSASAISYFAILGLDEEDVSGFGALDDNFGGVQPSGYGFTDDDGYWEWSSPNYGFIQQSESSWLLVYSSDYDWKPGDYEMKGAEDDFPVIDKGEVPEPTMLALLVAGGAFLFRRKRSTNS